MLSVRFMGRTTKSPSPCQIETIGHGPVQVEDARTLSPHCAGVRLLPGFMQLKAALWLVAQRCGSPAMMAPPANTSGYAASMVDVIPPPADSPVM